jgi:hypothetical protein
MRPSFILLTILAGSAALGTPRRGAKLSVVRAI